MSSRSSRSDEFTAPRRSGGDRLDQGQVLGGLPGQVALVEPDVLLGETAAEVLRGRHRVVVRAGADADTGGPFRRDHRFHAQACPQAEQVFAVLAGVDQRRELAVGVFSSLGCLCSPISIHHKFVFVIDLYFPFS